ncbi:hypothetical protein KUTeg_008495 [Tegillarca granosa]|uniref:Transcriptional repressor NF-X1 n=1 Tax=Tegillarca granosa TaxID=220873 RepID=A0ABQ9F9C5_TEGGR|nr:hypothetical protein KUTeg_008495 [Tegillarca granosa]
MSADNNNYYSGASNYYYNVPPSNYQGQVFIPQDIQYYQHTPPPTGAPLVFYTVNTPASQVQVPSMNIGEQQHVQFMSDGHTQGEITTSQDMTTGQYRGNRTNYSDNHVYHGNRGRGGNYKTRRWMPDEGQRHGMKNQDDISRNRYDKNQPHNTYRGSNDRKTSQFRRRDATKSDFNHKGANVTMATSIDESNVTMATSVDSSENKCTAVDQFVVNKNENKTHESLRDEKDAMQESTRFKGRKNDKPDDRVQYENRNKNYQHNNSNNYNRYNHDRRRKDYHDQGRGQGDYFHDHGRGRGGYYHGRGRGGRNQYGERNNWDSSLRSGYDNQYNRSSSGHLTHKRSNNYKHGKMSETDNTPNKHVAHSDGELQINATSSIAETCDDNKTTVNDSSNSQNDDVSSKHRNKQEDKNKTKEGEKGGNSQTRNKTRSFGSYEDGRNKLSTYQQPFSADMNEKKESKAGYISEKSRGRKQRPVITRTLSGKVDESQRGVLIEQLTLGTYECMVCCETVRGQNPVWSCTSCYHVFHLRCVKKWAKSPTAIVEGDTFGWRCPACQNVCNKFPSKIRDPELNRMETPHSCGEVCKKSRGDNCVHACNIQMMKCGVTEKLHCDKVCDKQLNCGKHNCKDVCHDGPCSPCEENVNQDNHHTCQQLCHEGPCGECPGETSITCRCGAIEKLVPCSEAQKFTDETPFCCDKRCNKKKSCGKHKCGLFCCVIEEHICDQICGKKLSCGLHKCDEICHRSNCPPCLLAGFDELLCHCGAEVMYPPIPCGTKPPECQRPCLRQHSCQHKVLHNCHSDDQCPPCVGPCLDEGTTCKQPCLNKRKDCDHICGAPCHEGSECPDVSCKAQVTIKCPCGNKVAKVQCMMGGNTSAEISEFQKITMQNFAGSIQGQSVDLSQFSGLKKGNKRQLECDADCSISNPQFVATVEKSLADLVQKAKESKHPSRSHAFPSMNMNHRKVVHELAEFYGCQTQSYDAEPNKNVVATAPRDKCWLPNVTLTALVQRELHPKAPTPIPHVHKESSIRQTAEAAKLSTDVLEDSKSKPKTDTQTTSSKSSKSNIDYFDFTET